jgi:hypothetical protein
MAAQALSSIDEPALKIMREAIKLPCCGERAASLALQMRGASAPVGGASSVLSPAIGLR